jgi:hypothetical protein
MKYVWIIGFLLASQVASGQQMNGMATTGISAGANTTPTPPIAAAPSFSPGAGSFSIPQSITLSSTTPSAAMFFTLDGTTPTTSSTRYTGAFTISSTTTLKAIATALGFTQSVVTTGVYTITSPSGISFSPAAGTYTGTQAVTVTCPTGLNCFYTTDGSAPNIASTQVTGLISVAASQTLTVIGAQTGAIAQNVQQTSSGWKCVTGVARTYGSITCQAGGGVGTTDPSALTLTFGTPMNLSITGAGSQALFVHSTPAPTCSNCTWLAHDVIFEPTAGPTVLENNEADANFTLPAQGNAEHSASLQCNQQAGTEQWQVDNQQGAWQDTGVTFGCPNSLTHETEARLDINWTNGDTSCGGFTCDHYNVLTVCIIGGGGCQSFNLGITLPGFTENFGNVMIVQHQPDLTSGTSSAGGRQVFQDNVTAGFFGTSVTASAAYVIN